MRQYLSGETHLFLGTQLRLQVEPALAQGVEKHGNRLVVGLGHEKSRSLARELRAESTAQRWRQSKGAGANEGDAKSQ